MPKSANTKILKSYVLAEDFNTISSKADQANLSNSAFIKKVCLGYQIRSKTDDKAVLALIAANAQLGRLGGLLKKHLAGNSCNAEIRSTLHEILQTKANIQKQVNQLAAALINMEATAE